MKSILSLFAVICCVGALSAQTTVLSEDFNANVVPPSGWTTQNLNGSAAAGYVSDLNGGAYHADEAGIGMCDDILATPAMDLSGLTQVYLHMNTFMGWISYLDSQSVDVSTDGGATFTMVWSDLGLNNAVDTIDLSAYAGQASVMVGFHYVGDYAHSSLIDNVLVNDSSTPPPPPGLTFAVNLPTSFAALPLSEDFSSGIVPSHMALTANDEYDVADVEAHCSVANGQLEMGLDPLSTNYHTVRNAMVLGIDGSSMSGAMIDFDMTDHGEELHAQDGIFVSADGLTWDVAHSGWAAQTEMVDVDLSCGGLVDISGTYYVMIGQSDNFPYAYLDGIDVDNLNIDDQAGHGGGTPPGLTYAITPMTAGSPVTFSITGAAPSSNCIIGYSLAGAGPINTAYGVVDMTPPISRFPTLTTDANGDCSLTLTVPANASGVTLYTQGLNNGMLTNSLAETVQ